MIPVAAAWWLFFQGTLMRKSTLGAALTIVAVFSVALPTSAAVTTFSTRAAFSAAAGSFATETFNTCGGTASLGIGFVLSSANPGPCASVLPGPSYSPPPGNDLYIAGTGQSANLSPA